MLSGLKRGETVLELKGITKSFPGVLANDHIDFDIKAGEIHALLGENGAGKTTLMNIIYGLLQPDSGEIFIRGEKVKIKSPLDSIDLGIGMVHQHLKVVQALSVIENILLGDPELGRILDAKKAKKEVEELCKRYGFKIDLDAKVWQLSAGERQTVEILRALYQGAKILIMDEPTSVLTPPETIELLKSLTAMAKKELTVIPFITHKLPVVLEISDRVTVLRNGKVVGRLITKNATEKILAEKMVGRDVVFRIKKPSVQLGQDVIEVKSIHALNDRGAKALNGVSFSIRAGEIFSVTGVAGNGQQELTEVLMGLRRLEDGKIIFQGEDISKFSIKKRWEKGIGYVPADRTTVGSAGDMSLAKNVAMNLYYDKEFVRRGTIDYKKIQKYTEKLISDFNVKAPSVNTLASHLSGGNLQKLILARVISRGPKLLITDLPTHGLDVGATEFVHNKLLELKKDKVAVLLISEDLDEALALGDRIAPIYEGQFMDILPRNEATKEKVGALMAGVRSKG